MVNISVQPVDMKPKDSLVPLNPLYCRCIQLTQSSFQAFREQILPDQLIIPYYARTSLVSHNIEELLHVLKPL